jgi:hypothetical protein
MNFLFKLFRKGENINENSFLFPPFKFNFPPNWRGDLVPINPDSKNKSAMVGPKDLSRINDWILRIIGEKMPLSIPPTLDMLRDLIMKIAIDICMFNRASKPREVTISNWTGFEFGWSEKYHLSPHHIKK